MVGIPFLHSCCTSVHYLQNSCLDMVRVGLITRGVSEVLHWGDNECEAFVERELAGEDHRAPVPVPFCQPRFRMDCREIEPDGFSMKRAYNGFIIWHGLWQMFV
jgi:hypothetical protein